MLAVSAVTTITSEIHQDHVPTGTALPYYRFSVIGGAPHHHVGAASPIGEAAIQLDAYAATGSVRDAMAEAARHALDGWAGTSATVGIDQIILDPPANSVEGLDAGRESPTFRSRIDARVFFAQAAPTL